MLTHLSQHAAARHCSPLLNEAKARLVRVLGGKLPSHLPILPSICTGGLTARFDKIHKTPVQGACNCDSARNGGQFQTRGTRKHRFGTQDDEARRRGLDLARVPNSRFPGVQAPDGRSSVFRGLEGGCCQISARAKSHLQVKTTNAAKWRDNFGKRHTSSEQPRGFQCRRVGERGATALRLWLYKAWFQDAAGPSSRRLDGQKSFQRGRRWYKYSSKGTLFGQNMGLLA